MKVGPIEVVADADVNPPIFTMHVSEVTPNLCEIKQGKDVLVIEAEQAYSLMLWLDLWLTSHGR